MSDERGGPPRTLEQAVAELRGHDLGTALALLRGLEIATARSLAGPHPTPVLDLGCGDGIVASKVFPRVDAGVDLSPGMVAQARGRVRWAVRADARRLPFRRDSFGTVFANSALEHMDDVDHVLAEVERVLRPGGVFLSLMPSDRFARPVGWLGKIVGRAAWAEYNRIHHHVNLLSPDEWRVRLQQHGLMVERLVRYGSPDFAAAFVVRDLLAVLDLARRWPPFTVRKAGRLSALGRVLPALSVSPLDHAREESGCWLAVLARKPRAPYPGHGGAFRVTRDDRTQARENSDVVAREEREELEGGSSPPQVPDPDHPVRDLPPARLIPIPPGLRPAAGMARAKQVRSPDGCRRSRDLPCPGLPPGNRRAPPWSSAARDFRTRLDAWGTGSGSPEVPPTRVGERSGNMSEPVPVRRGETVPERWIGAVWDPFRELQDLWDRMGRLLERPWEIGWYGGFWTPSVDIEETEDAYLVEADLPGVRREDVDVEIRDHDLYINGEVKEHERTGVLRRQTRRTGRFFYRATLPTGVDVERAEAKLENGVLRVRIPKTEQAKPRKVKIT